MEIDPAINVQSKRLLSTLMNSHNSSRNEGQSFALKSSREFASRSERVFEALEGLEHLAKNLQTPQDDGKKSDKAKTKGTVSGNFLKPNGPVPRRKDRRCMRVPDYLKHPEKWKKYSLIDVPDHTNEANTSAAMQFLQDIEKKKKTDSEHEESGVQFRKPLASSVAPASGAVKHNAFAGQRCRVMPECVVGVKKSVVSKKREKSGDSTARVQLQHLQVYDEDDDET